MSLSKENVLDIGSGPGRDGLILKNAGLQVTCMDASETMVKISSEKGLHSVVGDFLKLPFTNNSFDAVWAYTSLLHISKNEVDKALDEITRVLKQGGVLGLGLIEGNTEEYKENMGAGMKRFFSYYQKDEVEQLLKKHGFEVVYFEIMKPGSRNYLHFIAKK